MNSPPCYPVTAAQVATKWCRARNRARLQWPTTELGPPDAIDDSSHKNLEKGRTMKNVLATLVTAGAITAAALGLTTTANAAPAGPSSVDATINQLREQGFEVIVNRTGTAALEQCTVSAVRPGQTFSRSDTGSGKPGSAFDIVTTVTSKTVYVEITC
jgi:hypothetical protein